MLTIRRDKEIHREDRIHQGPSVHVASPAPGDRVEHPLGPEGGAYVDLILVDVPMAFRPVGIWAGQGA